MEEKITLFIPQGMKAEREYYQGFGRRELVQAGYGGIGLLAAAILVYAASGRIAYVMILILFGATGILGLVTRSQVTNLSVVDQIRQMVKYARDQQRYRYRQMEE